MKKIKTLVKAIISVATTMCIAAMCLVLTACNSDNVTLTVLNWGDYIDPDILVMFTEETGIRVNYSTFVDNEDLYVKLTRGGINADVVFPSDYMVQRLIEEELVLPLNFDNIPNHSYVGDRFTGLYYDPDDTYSVPFMWGTLGIIYNPTMLPDDYAVDSWETLWNEEHGRTVFMHSITRESFVVALQMLGYSANTTNISELHEARDMLIEQRKLVLAYTADDTRDKMVGREGSRGVIYNGCAFYGLELSDYELEFAMPKEGGLLWYDAMVVSATTKHQAEAEAFINFITRPDIALMNMEYVGYSAANMGGFDLLDEEWQECEIFWPREESLQNAETLIHLGEFTREYENAWSEVLMS
jgi:spermidine/putrescine transport system substrate-binding protein